MNEQLDLLSQQSSREPIHEGPLQRILGLTYVPTYISAHEQQSILAAVDSSLWLLDLRRRVQHYGYRYDYSARRVNTDMYLGALPAWAQALSDRLYSDGYFAKVPDQAIVNEYQPGQGITPHIDCEPCFGPSVASISLGSSAVMHFDHRKINEHVDILLEPGSLILLQGEARYDWKHSIFARKADRIAGGLVHRRRRVSVTFRTVILSEQDAMRAVSA